MKERRWLVGWRGRGGNHEVRGVKAIDPWEAARVVREHVGYHELQEGTEWLRICEWSIGCQKEFERMGFKAGLEWPGSQVAVAQSNECSTHCNAVDPVDPQLILKLEAAIEQTTKNINP